MEIKEEWLYEEHTYWLQAGKFYFALDEDEATRLRGDTAGQRAMLEARAGASMQDMLAFSESEGLTQCAALTKAGLRCKHSAQGRSYEFAEWLARANRAYCHIHQDRTMNVTNARGDE